MARWGERGRKNSRCRRVAGNKYITERNGRSSWERHGIVAFCTCQWNEWSSLVTYVRTLRDFIVFESMMGMRNWWFTPSCPWDVVQFDAILAETCEKSECGLLWHGYKQSCYHAKAFNTVKPNTQLWLYITHTHTLIWCVNQEMWI